MGKTKRSGPLAALSPEDPDDPGMTIVPVDRSLFIATAKSSPAPVPVVFFDFDDDTPRRVHLGARAMARRPA